MTRKIKIAYILTPITFGGAEKVSLNFLQNVDRSRFDLCPILLTRPWDEDPWFAVKIRELGYRFDVVPVAIKKGRDPLRVLRVVRILHSIFQKNSFDVVHTHGYFADICALPIARMMGTYSVATCHGYIGNDNRLKYYNHLDKIALRLCRRVIAVAEDIREELVSSGIHESRVVVIQNAAGHSCSRENLLERRRAKRHSLSIKDDEFVVGFVGRLSEEKGLKYLIKAASELKENSIAFRLLLIGEGPARNDLVSQVRSCGLDKTTIFAGFQKHVEEWLPALDAFVLPSLTEGTPMALLEAMSMGVPVIATAVGGVTKVVEDEVNGILVRPGDPHAISEKLQQLKTAPGFTDRLVKEGFNTIECRFDARQWCRLVEQQYLPPVLHPG